MAFLPFFSSGRGAACRALEWAVMGFCRGWGFTPCKGVQRFTGLYRALQGHCVQRYRVQQYRKGKKEGRREEEETETAAAAEKGEGVGEGRKGRKEKEKGVQRCGLWKG